MLEVRWVRPYLHFCGVITEKVKLGLNRAAAVFGGAPIFSYVVDCSVSESVKLFRSFSLCVRILGNSDYSCSSHDGSKSEYSNAQSTSLIDEVVVLSGCRLPHFSRIFKVRVNSPSFDSG